MYCYKLNNSYTVYVDPLYRSECIKESKKCKEKNNYTSYTYIDTHEKSNVIPPLLSNGSILLHKLYGKGQLLSTDQNYIMRIAFGNKILKFKYPDAINKNYLKKL